MKAYVDHLSAELTRQYLIYLETFMVDLWSDDGQIGFRVGYSLRADHRLRNFTVTVDAQSGINDVERRAIIAAVFVEIEDQIDDAIAAAAEIVTRISDRASSRYEDNHAEHALGRVAACLRTSTASSVRAGVPFGATVVTR